MIITYLSMSISKAFSILFLHFENAWNHSKRPKAISHCEKLFPKNLSLAYLARFSDINFSSFFLNFSHSY